MRFKKKGQFEVRKNNVTRIASHHLFWAKKKKSIDIFHDMICNLLHLQANSNNYTYLDPLLAFDTNKALCLTMLPLI
jgi:hypothetical protein